MEKEINHIKSLIAKSDESADSNNAMRYSQSALNNANALLGLSGLRAADKLKDVKEVLNK